jgi:protein-disulfide isomerase
LRADRRQILTTFLAAASALSAGLVFAATETILNDELMKSGPLGDRSLGSRSAPVTIIEYASPTCPPCARFATTVLPKLRARYIRTGKMRFIFREFPFDPVATGASVLARCADEDQYFDLIETLFREQDKWAVANPLPPLLDIAEHAGFSKKSFEACLSNQEVINGIESERARAAEQFKVSGTPTFFINGNKHTGIMSFDEIEQEAAPYLKK